MNSRFHLYALLFFVLSLVIILPANIHAQTEDIPVGVVAFVAVDTSDNANIYIIDLTSGNIGQVALPVEANADLSWHPEDNLLAFTTQDGGYGLLRSLRGCFDPAATCADTLEVILPFFIEELEWSPNGALLLFRTDEGLKLSPPRARPKDIQDQTLECSVGIAVSAEPYYLFCATTDELDSVQANVYQADDSEFSLLYETDTFSAITAFAVGPDGQSAVGTLESAGDSGFYASTETAATRLTDHQIHIYDLEFKPDGSQLAILGATSDSTGDNTLHDGDAAELFLYDPATSELTHTLGLTAAIALTWSPDGNHILVLTSPNNFLIVTPQTEIITPVTVSLPQPDLKILSLAWNPTQLILPSIPIAIPASPSTQIPESTTAATLTPWPTLTPFPTPLPTPYPTFTPYPTLTPYPTFTPFPSATPIPSATPGSPMGVNCEFAHVGSGGLPVAIGDTAEVTPYGTAIRFRTDPALTATRIRELRPGTRMKILSGPYCSQGYRWWQVQLESDGQIGYLADSDPQGYWIQVAAPAVPTQEPGTIYFSANNYTITQGECVTITWDVEGIKEVFLDSAGVIGHDSRVVCPAVTTTYTLRVVKLDSTEVLKQLTIVVNPP